MEACGVTKHTVILGSSKVQRIVTAKTNIVEMKKSRRKTKLTT